MKTKCTEVVTNIFQITLLEFPRLAISGDNILMAQNGISCTKSYMCALVLRIKICG